MTEIIERIVKSEGVPSKNDLWLKKDGDNLTLNAHDNGEWKQVSGPGGGPAGGAVSYNEQTLTEAQQMQARKNQGLYHKETLPGGTITWDGDTTGREDIGGMLFKVADTPTEMSLDAPKELTITSVYEGDSREQVMEVGPENVMDLSAGLTSGKIIGIGDFSDSDNPFIYIADNAVVSGLEGVLTGVYFRYGPDDDEIFYVSSFMYDESQKVSKISEEYLPDSMSVFPVTITETISESDEDSFFSDVQFEAVKSAIMSCRNVYFYLKIGDEIREITSKFRYSYQHAQFGDIEHIFIDFASPLYFNDNNTIGYDNQNE